MKRIAGISITLALLINGCSDDANDVNTASAIQEKNQVVLSQYDMSTLNEETKYTLAYMWNEERLAFDMYNALHVLYPEQNTLLNIPTKSEIKHIQWVEELVQRYDINITNLVDYTEHYSEAELRVFTPGKYNIEAIQNLYDDLYAKGKRSAQDALEVGCMIEVVDVNDLDADIIIATQNGADDVVAVFEILREGSYTHYWAFDSALKNIGVSEGCAVLGAEYTKTTQEYPQSNTKGQGTGKR